MTQLSPDAVSRAATLTTSHLLVAASAIVARLRRIHEHLPQAKDFDRAWQAHVDHTEALLNIVHVLMADGSCPDQVTELRKSVDLALSLANTRAREKSAAT
jgi:hypothetical protein